MRSGTVWEGKLGVKMEGGGYGLCGQGLCVGGRRCNKKWKRVDTVIAAKDCVGEKISRVGQNRIYAPYVTVFW